MTSWWSWSFWIKIIIFGSLQDVYKLLKPGGQIVFYESNPWNMMLKLHRWLSKLFGQKDSKQLLKRSQLYEVLSEVGFIRVFAVFNDFVYAPLTPSLVWLLRNFSILLENTPGLQTLAGSILIRCQNGFANLRFKRIRDGTRQTSAYSHRQESGAEDGAVR